LLDVQARAVLPVAFEQPLAEVGNALSEPPTALPELVLDDRHLLLEAIHLIAQLVPAKVELPLRPAGDSPQPM
jgi:hypothetical protein